MRFQRDCTPLGVIVVVTAIAMTGLIVAYLLRWALEESWGEVNASSPLTFRRELLDANPLGEQKVNLVIGGHQAARTKEKEAVERSGFPSLGDAQDLVNREHEGK